MPSNSVPPGAVARDAHLFIAPRFSDVYFDQSVALYAGQEAAKAVDLADRLWGPTLNRSEAQERAIVNLIAHTKEWSPYTLEAVRAYTKGCEERFGRTVDADLKAPVLMIKLCCEAGIDWNFQGFIEAMTAQLPFRSQPFSESDVVEYGRDLLRLAARADKYSDRTGVFVVGGLALEIASRGKPYTDREIRAFTPKKLLQLGELRMIENSRCADDTSAAAPQQTHEAKKISPSSGSLVCPPGVDQSIWGILKRLVAGGSVELSEGIDPGYLKAAKDLFSLSLQPHDYVIPTRQILDEINNFASVRGTRLSAATLNQVVSVAAQSFGRGPDAVRLLGAFEKARGNPFSNEEIAEYAPALSSALAALVTLHQSEYSGWGSGNPESPVVQLERLALRRGCPSAAVLNHLGSELAALEMHKSHEETAKWLHDFARNPALSNLNAGDVLTVATEAILVARTFIIPFNSVGVRIVETPSTQPGLSVYRPMARAH